MEKTEEKSLLTVERLQSSEEEGDPFAPLPWLLREALVLLPNYRALMFLLNYIINIVKDMALLFCTECPAENHPAHSPCLNSWVILNNYN